MKITTDHDQIQQAAGIALQDINLNLQPYQGGILPEPQTCLLAGGNYTHPWTRDAGYNTWYGLALVDPQASANTLRAVLSEDPDFGLRIGGQYWDAMIWAQGAWTHYLLTGDRDFLAQAYEATANSLRFFEATEYDPEDGLFRGAATMNDGISGYPDRYVTDQLHSGIFHSQDHVPGLHAGKGFGLPMKALSSNVIYCRAYRLAHAMASELENDTDQANYLQKADALQEAIRTQFWDDDLQEFKYLIDPWGGDHRQEAYGLAMAILFGIATPQQIERVFEYAYRSPHGMPMLWPTYDRYTDSSVVKEYVPSPKELPDLANDPLAWENLGIDLKPYGRHSSPIYSNANVAWAMACAEQGDIAEAFNEIDLISSKAVRDGNFQEVFHPDTGVPYGGVQEWELAEGIILWPSCRNQAWCATGFVAMLTRIILGMSLKPDGWTFSPHLPEGVSRIKIEGLHYQGRVVTLEYDPSQHDAVQVTEQ